MSDLHDYDRIFLEEIKQVTRSELLMWLAFEVERWRRIAIERELDRRDMLARVVLIGKS